MFRFWNSMQPVICLMGPTASGKTALSLLLAKALDGEIVSVDSAMVYRSMDIGTAKPTLMERQSIVHHLIDISDPAQAYSAAQFQQDAIRTIEEITARGKMAILTGGTMLYYKVLQQGLAPLPSADETVRSKLSSEAALVGWPKMHGRLAQVDPESARRINPTDPQRIQRALEVYELTGQPLSQLWRDTQNGLPFFYFVNVALIPEDRTHLQQQIGQRFHKMLADGLVEEVVQLTTRSDIHCDLPAIRSVGYRQVWQYLVGGCSYDEMVERAIIATRQLAKRQLTWLRSWEPLTRFNCADSQLFSKLYKHIRERTSQLQKE
jgi:tRNA dimethylallyltransferase